jgi:hypothetical protein
MFTRFLRHFVSHLSPSERAATNTARFLLYLGRAFAPVNVALA